MSCSSRASVLCAALLALPISLLSRSVPADVRPDSLESAAPDDTLTAAISILIDSSAATTSVLPAGVLDDTSGVLSETVGQLPPPGPRYVDAGLEMTAFLGSSSFTDEERPRAESAVGIRFVEVAFWPAERMRLWFQFDNGLTLDNVVIAAHNNTVPSGYLGGFVNYARNQTTRIEVGWRSLPGVVGQTLLRTEHVVGLGRGYAWKLGLWLGMRSDNRNEWVAHSGLNLPITDRLSVAPTAFYSRNGMPNEREWRVLLSGEYRFANAWTVAAGLAGGLAETGYVGDYRAVWDRYVKITSPVSRLNRLHLLVRNEAVGDTDDLTVIALGLTIGLAERQ